MMQDGVNLLIQHRVDRGDIGIQSGSERVQIVQESPRQATKPGDDRFVTVRRQKSVSWSSSA
jgi:hypothetical protein